jgi:uncharacterized membrane protein
MNVFNYIAISIATAGSIIIIWGAIITIFKVLALERRRVTNIKSDISSEPIRHQFSSYLVLGLDFMLAADIIHTIHKPILNELYILAMIVGIRSVISFFLNKEMTGVKLNKAKIENEQSN